MPLYFILADFGPKIGKAWVERDPASADRPTTIQDLARSEFGAGVTIDQVVELDLASGTARDVTAGIALDVMSLWADDGQSLTSDQIDFIERFCGVGAAHCFARAA